MIGAGALTMTTAACGNGVASRGPAAADARVDAALNYMYRTVPGTEELSRKAAGVLVMPLITKAGFGVGGSYGRGALRINDVTVDYYSATQATLGLQIGAQQYAHALFFMTPEALREFRRSPGWAVGADVEYVVSNRGNNLGVETTTVLDPVIAVVFGQSGLLAGATIEGTKYNRIIP
ncbi:twin-arginine translocation pathway signal [Loktanella sp. 22II-4b]|nr:twin-arginine translocation pathway signal [Loktanella sp. 22II-4b]